MQQKRVNPKIIISALVLIVAGLLAFRFLMPANCSALLQDTKSVTITMTEKTAVDGYPENLSYTVTFEEDDRALIELNIMFTEYNCFFTLKQLDWADASMTIHNVPLTFHVDVSTGDGVRYFELAGKYLISGENVWRVGRGAKGEILQQRLFDFVLDHQEESQ